MIFARKLLFIAVLISAFSNRSQAQGVVSGQETLVTASGSTISITPPNTSALNYSSPTGTNTFIIPLTNPTVSVRIYVTNNTANACASGFTAQMWAATDAQTSSFNNSLQNWQVVPIQDSTGNLTQTLLPSIPANGAAYFSSTAVSAPRVALQFVNTTAGCATTNIELSAVISTVSVTSPLISTNGPTGFNGQTANQVQGVVSQQQNGQPVNPIVNGGLQLPLNGNFLTAGIDNWSSTFLGIPSGGSGLFIIGSTPGPGKQNELAIAFESILQDNSTTNLVSPWVCAVGSTCAGSGGHISTASMKNPKLGTPYARTFSNVTATGQDLLAFVLVQSPTATIRQTTVVASGTNVMGATLTGSALIVSAECITAACTLGIPTDTQGNIYNLLTVQNFNNGLRNGALWVWASTTLSVVGANTVTFPVVSGTITETTAVEVSGITPAVLTELAVSSQSDPTGAQVVRLDAQANNQFVASVTLSTNTTTQIQIAPTVIANVPVRAYVTDFQINTTTAGTATTIQLKTGTGSNCGTGTANLSAIAYPNTTVAITNILGTRTPLIAPLQNAVCATQAGTTPGTSVIEIRGFLAP